MLAAMSSYSPTAQLHSVRAVHDGPARIADERVGLNDTFAAALTGWVGTMWSVYLKVAIAAAWMALATWGPLRPVDPYPFQFMLFMGNVVQLLLCFVILVGQRVLNRAADSRAMQTYQNAEAIFQQVSRLQEHLDRQDRLLSRGISLLQSRPHPWLEQHRVEQPPQARDMAASLNGRIAAAMTRRLGSMWAFYAAALFQVAWLTLATWGPLQSVDPYPFRFLLNLSSLVQLLFMFVIMVGQDVIGHAGDRRSEQTFLDAQAILYECQRMEQRLTRQDRILESLCEYHGSRVVEQLARAWHASYLDACQDRGEPLFSRPSLRPWDELAAEYRASNRDQAEHVGEKLAALGCVLVPAFNSSLAFEFRDEGEVMLLAHMEHERWMRERQRQGFQWGPVRTGRRHPDMVAWEDLSDEAKEKDVEIVREIPRILAQAGFQVLRVADADSNTA